MQEQTPPLALADYLATLLRTGYGSERALDLAREYALALLHGTGASLLALVAGQMEQAALACGVHSEQGRSQREAYETRVHECLQAQYRRI